MDLQKGNRLGYCHPLYVSSLSAFGEPHLLPESGGSLLLRAIPDTELKDCISPYPLFSCQRPQALAGDLGRLTLEESIVSITLVTDPLTSEDTINAWTPLFDVVEPYKQHYLVDLTADGLNRVSRLHMKKSRRLAEEGGTIRIEGGTVSDDFLDMWTGRLYATLGQRRDLSPLSQFSAQSFRLQARVPGLTIVSAYASAHQEPEELIGASWYYRAGEAVYYHVNAQTAEGYEKKASFAIMHAAIEHFRSEGIKTLVLGSGGGAYTADDGLMRFKRGWSTGQAQNFILGKIVDASAYTKLSAGYASTFFPAYRTPG